MRFGSIGLAAGIGGVFFAVAFLQKRLLALISGADVYLELIVFASAAAGVLLGVLLATTKLARSQTPLPPTVPAILAGIWIAVSAYLVMPFAALLSGITPIIATLLLSIVLFAPYFGLIGTSAFRIAHGSREHTSPGARTAGLMIAGALTGGVVLTAIMLLIVAPWIGYSISLSICGFLLVLMGGLTAVYHRRKRASVISAISIMVLWGAVFVEPPAVMHPPNTIVRWTFEGPAHAIQVVDSEFGRHLLVDGRIRARMNPDTWQSSDPVSGVLELPAFLFSSPGSSLFINTGAGTLPRSYFYSGWRVDVIEHDPVILEAARKWFHWQERGITVVTAESRTYLAANTAKYDAVILEKPRLEEHPAFFLTEEFFGLVSESLTDRGVFGMNVEVEGWDDPLVGRLFASLKKDFREVRVLPMAEPPDQFGSVVFLASGHQLTLARELDYDFSDPDYRFSLSYHRNHAWENQFVPVAGLTALLTDDHNSLDISLHRILQAEMKETRLYFDQRRFLW